MIEDQIKLDEAVLRKKIARSLRMMRAMLSIGQSEMGRIMKIAHSTMCRWENDQIDVVTINRLIYLRDKVGISLDAIVDGMVAVENGTIVLKTKGKPNGKSGDNATQEA